MCTNCYNIEYYFAYLVSLSSIEISHSLVVIFSQEKGIHLWWLNIFLGVLVLVWMCWIYNQNKLPGFNINL
jgi:hypothetical protein